MRLDDLYDVGAQDGPEHVHDRYVTVPNVLSALRLCALPFLWLDITQGRFIRALVVLAVFASTDWVDGFVARRFDQVSRIGKLLDPASDRVLIVVVAVASVVGDVVPWWAVAVLLVRDVLVAGTAMFLVSRGRSAPPVSRAGKTATFQLLFAFPLLLGAAALDGTGATVARVLGWIALACGATLYWVAAWQYLVVLRDEVGDGDDGNDTDASAAGG